MPKKQVLPLDDEDDVTKEDYEDKDKLADVFSEPVDDEFDDSVDDSNEDSSSASAEIGDDF
ncbi:MAG: hypothetical protein AABY01_00185 [Nanoarchaeota archaeon]